MSYSASTHDEDLTGRDLGDYRVLRRLGVGGMAIVYLAEQVSLGRQVALKVLQAKFAGDPSYVARFHHEARSAASLVHSNIVQIYDVGDADRVHFIAQEYIRGKNLGEMLARQRTLEPRLVLNVMRQVAAALCQAEEAGIVHRDIKPDNIMLSQSGEVKVADFGLARLQNVNSPAMTQEGVALGTPLYMSPEQIEGRPLDCRSDIYSLGVTCYHLIAGDPPHQGDAALAIAMQHLRVEPEPLESLRPDAPQSLARLVHRMMAKDPGSRPATPRELLSELRQLAEIAAEQGWGEGPQEWLLAEWIAATDSSNGATQRLGQLMQASASLQPTSRSVGKAALLAVAMTIGGVALAIATRSPSALDGEVSAPIDKRDSVWAQIYHAKMAPSKEAWEAVWLEFPEADPYEVALAKQGMVRYYLFHSQDFAAALDPLGYLDDSSNVNESQTSLRSFTFAALAIVHHHLGEFEASRQAYSQLTSDMRDEIRAGDRRLDDLLKTVEPYLQD